MISEAKAFWDAISGKVKSLIHAETENALRMQRYDVTTAPNGTVMGVTQPFGANEIFLPYSKEVAGASVGDTVLVAWWGSMSNAKVYYFAKGYDGGAGGSDAVVATITFPAAWTDSGNGYWTASPTVADATISDTSKIDLQITAAQFISLQNDSVESLYIENNNAALTAYSVGGHPSAAITLQCSITGTVAPTPPVNPSLDMIYPVGSIYTNASNVNPENTIGGTWISVTPEPAVSVVGPLWTNESPTSSFAPQTISLDLSAYESVKVVFLADYNTSSRLHNTTNTVECAVGESAFTHHLVVASGTWPSNAYDGFRVFSVTASGVAFQDCYERGSTHNSTEIPQRIYGVKTVHTFNGLYVWQRTA